MTSTRWINAGFGIVLLVFNFLPAPPLAAWLLALIVLCAVGGYLTGHHSTIFVAVAVCLAVGALFNSVLFEAQTFLAGFFVAEAAIAGLSTWSGTRLEHRRQPL